MFEDICKTATNCLRIQESYLQHCFYIVIWSLLRDSGPYWWSLRKEMITRQEKTTDFINMVHTTVDSTESPSSLAGFSMLLFANLLRLCLYYRVCRLELCYLWRV